VTLQNAAVCQQSYQSPICRRKLGKSRRRSSEHVWVNTVNFTVSARIHSPASSYSGIVHHLLGPNIHIQGRNNQSHIDPLPYHRYTDLVSRYQPLTHQVRIGFPQVLRPTPMRLRNPPTRVACRNNHTRATLKALRVFDRHKTKVPLECRGQGEPSWAA
jgi:hypothetical protein